MNRRFCLAFRFAALFCVNAAPQVFSAEDVRITDVPDYAWYAGCFGTAGGNLAGYWDRHGFPEFYTGPTGNGVAPLNSAGPNAGIRSLWASRAGTDGRPADLPGHMDDYWTSVANDSSYESTELDPYLIAGRPEHEPDCLSDFMGSSQNKWPDLDGECSGNIDGYSFNFWDKQGLPRENFTPPDFDGKPIRDVQSGLRQWVRSRGYEANVLSQLADFNPTLLPGRGFRFEDLKAEILRGNPVLLILQNPGEYSRNKPGMPRANPNVHAMLAFRFIVTDEGDQLVQYRTSWATGDGNETISVWGPQIWQAGMTLRGVVMFHPLPKITSIQRANGKISIRWDGANSTLWDEVNEIEVSAHSYVVESASSVRGKFTPVGDPTTLREVTMSDPGGQHLFFRVRVTNPAYDGVGGL